MLAIDPTSKALLPVRKQTSRPTSRVTRSPEVLPISFSVSLSFRSDRTFKKGDCSNSTARASFSVLSNTGSPVVLAKSAITITSLSVKRGGLRKWK